MGVKEINDRERDSERGDYFHEIPIQQSLGSVVFD